jgi:hypothetical protein
MNCTLLTRRCKWTAWPTCSHGFHLLCQLQDWALTHWLHGWHDGLPRDAARCQVWACCRSRWYLRIETLQYLLYKKNLQHEHFPLYAWGISLEAMAPLVYVCFSFWKAGVPQTYIVHCHGNVTENGCFENQNAIS